MRAKGTEQGTKYRHTELISKGGREKVCDTGKLLRADAQSSWGHSETHGTPTQTDEPSSRQAHISQFSAKSSIFCYIFKSNVYQQHSSKTRALCHHSADTFRVFFSPTQFRSTLCASMSLLLFCKHFINHSPRLFYHIQDISSSQLPQKTRYTELLSGEGKIA